MFSSFCNFPFAFDLARGTDRAAAGTSSTEARDSARAETLKEPTEIAEKPVVAS